MTETDQEFLRRLKTTYGLPTVGDAERYRRIHMDAFWRRVFRRKPKD